MHPRFFVYLSGMLVCGLGVLVCGATTSFAASDVTTLASPLPVEGIVRDGDIITYDRVANTYRASVRVADEDTFGVVVDDPVLYMHESEDASGTRPIVRYGEAYVNVTDLGGEIHSGDLVTTSRITGHGQRIGRDVGGYILGFAIGEVTYDVDATPLSVDGASVRTGRVLVALRIGDYRTVLDSEIRDMLGQYASGSAMAVAESEQAGNGFDTFKLIRYVLGAFVAITAVVLALRRFGDLFAQSIISVGRNPLARSQIRSILVWNAVLIVLVSGVGLGIGVAIIVM